MPSIWKRVFSRTIPYSPMKTRAKRSRLLFQLEILEDRTVPANITVTGVGDAIAVDGVVTLREAITSANNNADVNADVVSVGDYGVDTISFCIQGDGVHTISPLSQLPDITDPVIIDGYTQHGASKNTNGPGLGNNAVLQIELDGSSAGASANGLAVSVGNTVIKGLVINRFGQNGIVLSFGAGNTIAGNFIGTNAAGTSALANSVNGVLINQGANHNFIGTNGDGQDDATEGNVISGNAQRGVFITDVGSNNNVLAGNLIGSNAAGIAALGNISWGVTIDAGASANVIGGTVTGSGNLISGNGVEANSIGGVLVNGSNTSNNVLVGNLIGTDAAGLSALPNNYAGVVITGATTGNTIGGVTAASRNIISGNVRSGVIINGTATNNSVQGNYIGVDIQGQRAIPNLRDGIQVTGGSTGNTIGGAIDGAGNLISGNARHGIVLTNVGTTNNLVQGNLIGTNAAGTAAIGNGQIGIFVSAGASHNIVGGTTPQARNIISGNVIDGILITDSGTSNNVVQGNYIGTDISGINSIPNRSNGAIIAFNAANNLIGGTNAAERNVISGNNDHPGDWGVLLQQTGANNVVSGNYIGVDATGLAALPNGVGLVLYESSGSTIGGTTTGARNVISGNAGIGVQLTGSGTSNNLIVGNFIGTDATGTLRRGNGDDGIRIENGAAFNTIGGLTTTPGTGYGNVISGNGSDGIQISNLAHDNTILGNLVGLNADGTAGITNGTASSGSGIYVPVSYGNIIGGSAPGAGNVISSSFYWAIHLEGANTSNTHDNVIAGNRIGTNAAGTAPIGNGFGGVILTAGAFNNTIGGSTVGTRNLISGNTTNLGDGILLTGAGTRANLVQGNFIGTNADGTAAIANSGSGVSIENGASTNTIGGTTALARNILSGNGWEGVTITDSGTTGNVVQGNYIGTDVTGMRSISNAGNGLGILFSATNNLVGGTSPSQRNVISGNDLLHDTWGVLLQQTGSQNVVSGNYIGVDATGLRALPNGGGVFSYFASGDTIGGTTPGSGNVISGSTGYIDASTPGNGIVFYGSTCTNNLLAGNLIGTDAFGASAIPNTSIGVVLMAGANHNTIGGITSTAGNVISSSSGAGVLITGVGTTSNAILGNSIYNTLSGLGIDITLPGNTVADGPNPNDPGDADAGSNNLQNYPVLTTVAGGNNTIVQGTFNSTPDSTFRVEFFSNTATNPSGYGEGEHYLGFANVTTDHNGDASFNVTLTTATFVGQYITSTATDSGGNTSEFSQAIIVPQIGSMTTVGSSTNPSVYGDLVTFTATVTSDLPYQYIPTGSVQFVIDGTNFGDVVTLDANGAATSGDISRLSAGSHTIVANYLGDTNFEASSGSFTQSVSQRPLTITATGVNKIYDGTVVATVTLSDNRLPGDVFTDNYASASFNNKNVGTSKSVSVSGLSISGTDAGNYALQNTTASTTANITPRPLTVTAHGVNKVYDGTITATVNLTDNRIAGDVLTDSYASASFTDKNVGTGKQVNVTGISISGIDAGNYALQNTTDSTTARITAATLTVRANAASRSEGTTNPIFTASYSGFVGGDTLANSTTGSPRLTTIATIDSPPGTYSINVAQNTLAATNYTFTLVNGTLTIINLPPFVSAPANQSITQGVSNLINLGSFSDPGINDGKWDVSVNWGDGTANTTFKMSALGALTPQLHTYANIGSYTVTVTVTDSFGSSGRASFSVTVPFTFSLGSSGFDKGTAITTVGGYLYVTGFFQGAVDFDPGPTTTNLTSVSTDDLYVAKYNASTRTLVWAKRIGGNGGDLESEGIAVDGSGNVYTTGGFHGTLDFDPGTSTYNMVSAGALDIFISKLNSSGNFVWAKHVGGAGDDYADGITVDGSGNVYTTGSFSGTVDFNPDPAVVANQTSAGFYDVFVSKLNSSGTFVWAKRLGGSADDVSYGIAVDGSGNVYTTGYFSGTADFDPGAASFNMASVGGHDIFISKLNSSGNFVWAKRLGGAADDYALGITLDGSGNVYTTGGFSGTADFDPAATTFNVTSAGGQDIFVSKLNSSGTFVWAKRLGGAADEEAEGIAVDGSGNVYTTGWFSGTTDFDPSASVFYLTSYGSGDVFVSKLNSSGSFVWAQQCGGNNFDEAVGISVDNSSNVYTTGFFSGTADFDPGTGVYNLSSNAGSSDIFVSKLLGTTGGQALRALGDTSTNSTNAPILTEKQLKPIVEAAIAQWGQAGLDAAQLKMLMSLDVEITDLPDGYLGLKLPNLVWIDKDASGLGWYIDATPVEDEEFTQVFSAHDLLALPGSRAYGKIDLLTVVEHELGHMLGLEHSANPADLMAEDLGTSNRKLPDGADVAAIPQRANATDDVFSDNLAVKALSRDLGVHDMLFGVIGNDHLVGGTAHSLFTGGITPNDPISTALLSIFTERKRPNQTYPYRLNHLRGSPSDVLNGSNKLIWGWTVLDDAVLGTHRPCSTWRNEHE